MTSFEKTRSIFQRAQIQQGKYPFEKLLFKIEHCAGENSMATFSSSKLASKTAISWFEFLFDTTGDLLKKHLGEASAGL